MEYSNDICADRIERMLRRVGANGHAGLVLREYHDRRIADLEADLADTLRAVLHHFGPDGANKVTAEVLKLKGKR